jgi:hypothetical protein
MTYGCCSWTKLQIYCVLLLSLGVHCSALAASVAKSKAPHPNQHPEILSQDERISLYAAPVAFMKFCDIKMSEDALSQTLSSVGIKSSIIPYLKTRAEKLVVLLRVQYDTKDKKVDFCKRSRTIPMVNRLME